MQLGRISAPSTSHFVEQTLVLTGGINTTLYHFVEQTLVLTCINEKANNSIWKFNAIRLKEPNLIVYHSFLSKTIKNLEIAEKLTQKPKIKKPLILNI